MSSCSLLVGSRVVLRSEGGPPEAEYALFDEGEIELQALSPGSIREIAYRTTVAQARARLAAEGVTATFAEATAIVIAPKVKEAYARGRVVRRVASYLGAAELFEGKVYDAHLRTYRGGWLDLDALSADLAMPGAAAALQALHLAAFLSECDDDAVIVLSTADLMRSRRAGERTYRRVALEDALSLPEALRALDASPELAPAERDYGPGRTELLEGVRARMALAPSAAAQARMVLVERALTMRQRPERGPLADPDIWELEVKLTMGDASGVLEQAERIERGRGRQPATAYLRARAALLAGTEDPRAIAERVSALAQSMSKFGELELLAAQAWAAAGDFKQAHAFARLVAEDTTEQDDLRTRAADIASDVAAGRRPLLSYFPQAIVAKRAEAILSERAVSRARSRRVLERDARSEPPSRPAMRRSNSIVPRAHEDDEAPDTSVEPATDVIPTSSLAPTEASRDVSEIEIPRMPAPPAMSYPPAQRTSRPPAPDAEDARDADPEPPTPVRPPTNRARIVDPSAAGAVQRYAGYPGASQPPMTSVMPHRSVAPSPAFVAPAPPRRDGRVESVERLSLPPGLHGETPKGDALPRTAQEARVAFTHLARELAREYRERYSYELRTDLASIEFMQRELLDRFPDGLTSDEDGIDVRRHGAFLSEIIARTIGGYWHDIVPSELGYWAMIVPPRTRVLPFGRVFRFLSLGKKDKDLAAFYADLQERALRSAT